ncbi:MAG: alpha/beta fold hydrolase [Fidelibacterota bacterium]|nr:MAG: alpha/beta fold hydrolase [Candidatus Neomarinimicrobiota bacterium]
MKKWQKVTLGTVGAVVSLVIIAAFALSYYISASLGSNPLEKRREFWATLPELHADTLLAEYGLLECEKITLVTADDLELEALHFPSHNGAAIIIQHGGFARGSDMIPMAAMFIRQGYGAILPTLRAHGESGGELITFGHHEVKDLEAAYQYLANRPEVDPEKIGAIGTSMGGALVILYAADNPKIKAVVAESPYHELSKESVAAFTGMPWPIPALIVYFLEQKLGFPLASVSPVNRIGEISPRPVFIMMGGSDPMVPPEGGEALYAAAGEPRTYWYEDHLDHLGFSQLINMLIAEPDLTQAAAFEARVTAFFNQYLLGEN